MFSVLKRWRDTGYRNIYGTETIQEWSARFTSDVKGPIRILDIGCGDGRDLLAVGQALGRQDVELYGIECTESLAKQARKHGVKTFALDLECMSLPFADNFFDVVIANQVLEHLKNWVWALQEQIRVTKVDRTAIVGVPNLAALHNRALVILGRQPSCIKADGPHVRGFTLHELLRLASSIDGIESLATGGTYMYGFPPQMGKALGKMFPSLSSTILIALRKNSETANALSILGDASRFETNFYVGAAAGR